MEFLSRKAQEFVEVPPEADLYQLIGEGLSELLPRASIGINSYDPISDSITVRAFYSDKDREFINTCLGREFTGFEMPLSAIPQTLRTFAYGELLKGKLFYSEESLYNLFFQQVPADICERIKETLNLGDKHYSIGLSRQNLLFGAVNFTLREGEILHNPQIIETFIRQASVVLHRRLTEDSLKKSEFRYRGIVEDQTEYIIRFQPDGTITFINRSFCRFFQRELHEVLGRSIFSFIGEDDHAPLHELLKSLDARHSVQSAAYRFSDSTGTIRWIHWTNRAIFDDDGTLVEYQSVGRDVTEQKEAEAKIRQYIADREFLMQTAMELMNLPDDTNIYQYIADRTQVLLPGQVIAVASINPSERTITTQSLTGLDATVLEEFRNHGISIVGQPFCLDKDQSIETLLKKKFLIEGPRLYNLFFRQFPEEVCIHLENRMGFGKNYIMGFTHEGKTFGSIIIILRPGEELKNKELLELFLNQVSIALLRRHTRQELTESEKLYRSVIENIQDVFYRSDTEGNLIMASPSWAKVLGYDSLDDCIGFNIADKFWFEPELRKAFIDAVYKHGSVNDYEVVLKRRDGIPLHVSTSSHLYYDDTGTLLGVEGIFRDINERRIAAEQIQNTISQIEFFSRKLQEFIELPPDSDIYDAIGQGFREFVPDGMIIVNNYDRDSGKIIIKSLIGEKARTIAQKYLQGNLTGMSLQVDEPVPRDIPPGKIYPLQKTFQSILSQNFSQDISEEIIKELNLGNFYYISLSWKGSSLGNVTFALPEGEKLEKIPFIELYGKAASIVLQRPFTDDSLRESQEIFSSVAENAPVSIAIISSDGRYHYVNKKFIETFGYDLNDVKTGRDWFSLVYPDPEYRKKVIATWKSDYEKSGSGIVRPRTFTVRCRDGTDREILFRPVTLSDGKDCVVYEDITEQYKSQEVQKLLASIVENSRDAIISKKTDGTILSWNNAAEQLYGFTRDEMIGRNISIIIPEERRVEMSEIRTLIKEKKVSSHSIETVRMRKDGRVIDIELTISPITNEAGIVIGASTIERDISDKKSEERLQEREEKYRAIVETMKIGVYRSTGDPRGRFVWGNTSLLNILGYPSFDALRQIDVADLFTEPQGREKLLGDLRQSGFVMNREISLKRADGKPICVRVTALTKVNPSGDIEFINGAVEDITEYKQDSSELQALRHELVDIIEVLPDPIMIINQNHEVTGWNSAMEHITGVSKHEIIGFSDFTHVFNVQGAQRPALIDLLDAPDNEIGQVYSHVTREGDSLIAEEFVQALYSGRGAYAWIKASPLYDPAGKKIGAIEIIRDISKGREITEASRNAIIGSGSDIPAEGPVSEDFTHGFPEPGKTGTPGILSPLYLSQALRMAQDYIAILDKSGKCLWVNDAFVDVVDAETSADLAGKSLALFIAPEFRKAALNCLSDVRKNGHKLISLMMLSSSGRIPVEANISAILAKGGDLFGFIAVARNVEREKVDKPKQR
jgi:PAS domain S-box-containing protein